MGWWSANILGGDAPLDYLASFETHFGLTASKPGCANVCYPTEQLNACAEEGVLDFIQQCYEPDIAAQVVALCYLRAGAHIPPRLSGAARNACLNEDLTHWSRPADRACILHNFATVLLCYDNSTPQFGLK